jgi:hypothetical protein
MVLSDMVHGCVCACVGAGGWWPVDQYTSGVGRERSVRYFLILKIV